ncbi:glutamyl-tRNA synthetase, putative [Theileria equi strain WA]|uniref:glutamate--tRNA ligase n=1 Tax=Theileria equi strain WA TaxID=1537102 RepID=L1LG37_THEEQ|nr:glutamyl-tRNA synthetase, putative [Theileria equi strain WA]EKX74229.1 glutamyl-tRNA synthetase, putative [Theileria equi strain WA]|eukprot:XP_004833681.1 glutamyl-tRNA synthetase, putative [Theileria equi strain WA]
MTEGSGDKLTVHYPVQSPPLGAIVVFCISKYLEKESNLLVDFLLDNKLSNNQFLLNNTPCNEVELLTSLCQKLPHCEKLLDADKSELTFWLDNFTTEKKALSEKKQVHPLGEEYLGRMNTHLTYRTYIIGYRLSLADILHYSLVRRFSDLDAHKSKFPHLARWYKFVSNSPGISIILIYMTILGISTGLGSLEGIINKQVFRKPFTKQEQQDNSYKGVLKDAIEGHVVTRFPPEPSGYLHIGHAKAALLNYYFARKYNGKLLVRFDDTNPCKEKDEYVESILEDLGKLEIEYDELSYTSDYFDTFQEYAIQLIKDGHAYCDDTDVETMRKQRGEGIESPARNNSVETNLLLFQEMMKGSEVGVKNCLRAKMDMSSKNKSLRDPVFYRCIVDVPHHRQGTKYKIYPTYEFACPIIDSLQGVTHSLRTNEYSDRIPLYKWVLEKCNMRHVEIYEFSRMNFVKTTLSKRRLRWFVDNGIVTGWDDPRMPTVKGILRRGLTVKALLDFVLEQGPSKSVNLMEWDKLWAKNKQIIDPIVPRYAAVGTDYVVLKLTNFSGNDTSKRALHPKNAELGECDIWFTDSVLIEKADAELIENNEEITLMRWGNAFVNTETWEAALNPSGNFKSTKKKLHWLPNLPGQLVPCTLTEYGYLITVDKIDAQLLTDDDSIRAFLEPQTEWVTECLGEANLRHLKEGDMLQLERRGYYILDKVSDDGKMTFVQIPDGKVKKTQGKSS